jgi:beta-xylosidase
MRCREELGIPRPRRHNVVTSKDPTIAAPVLESTLALQTKPMAALQLGMDHLPVQSQAYQEEQQPQAHTRQIDVERWVAQHLDELASEKVALDS